MAAGAVSVVLGKVVELIHGELNLLTYLPDEVINLRDELEFMRAFLQDADAAQRDEGEKNKVWVKKVRDVAFDTEDILDEFRLWLRHHHQRRRSRPNSWCLEIWTSKSVRACHRIAAKLQVVKSRVEGISQARVRYADGPKKGDATHPPSSTAAGAFPEPRDDGNAAVFGEEHLVGVLEPKKELLSFLLEDAPRRAAVAVVGMGGLGKSTLAGLVFKDGSVTSHFEHRVWITVSRQFKLLELLNDVNRQLSAGAPEDSSVGMLKNSIQNFLHGKRYLIVLDDLWSVAAWDEIQNAFPGNNLGSRVMLTTRIADVASNAVQFHGGTSYSMKALSKNLSLSLFNRKAFSGGPCPELLKPVCNKILERCEGLPLAISAIGGMLATKDKTSVHQFEKVHHSLGAELVGNDNLNSVKKILSLSFDDLPSNVKSCLLYLTVFPKDGIVKNKLIRLWIAESFVLRENGSKSSLEEIGDAYLNELLNRSLIQVSARHDDGRVRACRVHDLIREIVTLKASDEHFAMIANQETDGVPGRVRRLSVHKTVENVPEELEYFSKLRSLLLFQVKQFTSDFSFPKLLKRSRLLQVLDCSDALIDTFPKEITKLYNLRYLSLRDTEVKAIPGSISELRNLQMLNLKGTGIELIPEILQLTSLRHIHSYRSVQHGPSDAFTETRGFKALKGIEALTSLQSLCHMDVSEDSAEILQSLRKLTQLRRLGVLELRREDGAHLCSAIDQMRHLVTLDLTAKNAKEILSLQSLSSTPLSLQRLYMAGRLERLPHWIPQLLGLKTLVLRFSGLRVDPLESLKQLCNLVVLRLYKAYDSKELLFGAGIFPVLRILDLRNLGELRKMVVSENAIPLLEILVFEECRVLKEIPDGIKNLSRLQQLELIAMDSELVRKIRRKDEHDEDYSKVKHINSIKILPTRGKEDADESTHQYMSSISSSVGGENILRNHDFSGGMDGWEANGCTVAVVESDIPNSWCAVVRDGTGKGRGLEQDITDRVSRDSVYLVSASFGVSGLVSGALEVMAGLRLTYPEQEDEHVHVGSICVSNEAGGDLKLKGTIVLSTRPDSVRFYFEGPAPGSEISIRSVSIKESEIILNPRFEKGMSEWSENGCNIIESQSMGFGGYITPFSGTRFACAQNRKQDWNGIAQDITERVLQKLAYEVTAVVRVFSDSDATNADVIATVYIKTKDGRKEYLEINKVKATDSEWKTLRGKFLINSEPLEVVIYVEGPPPEVDILLDSLVIKHATRVLPATRLVIENPEFGVNIIKNHNLTNGSIEGWFGLGNCILSMESSSECALAPLATEALAEHRNEGPSDPSGRFLLSSNRTEDWMGPAQMITEKVKLFLTYQVSALVMIGYGAKGPQNVTVKLEVEIKGVPEKYWIDGGQVEANNDGWSEIAGSFRLENQPEKIMLYVFGPDPGIELMVRGLQVFPVDRTARFEHLKRETDKIRKREVILKIQRAADFPATPVKVRQTKNSFPFGSCLYRANLESEKFKTFFLKHFDWAVFANELKWGETEKERGKIACEEADTMLEFCKSNNVRVRGHCAFWDSNDPTWVTSLTEKKLLKALNDRLKGFIEICKGRAEHYDVFNELLSGSFYRDKLHEREIAELFKRAKKLDPNARIFMNEENVDNGRSARSSPQKYIELIKDLERNGAKINGIGIQGQNKSPVGEIIQSALDKLHELKLPVWYTEMKVFSNDEHVRADDLEVMIREAFAHPAVEGIMLWGFWELFAKNGKKSVSHLVDAEGEPNEAGRRFLALKSEFLSDAEGNFNEEGQFRYRGFHGTYTAEIEIGSETICKTFEVVKDDTGSSLEVNIDI